MSKTKLPTNIQIFVDHLSVGLDSAGLKLADFSPTVVKDRETKEQGFLFFQEINDDDTSVVVFNDRVEFGSNSVSLIMNNEQPPTKVAILFLVAMIQKEPLLPPTCPCCEEEEVTK